MALQIPDPVLHIILDMVAACDIVAMRAVCRPYYCATNKWATVERISCSEDGTDLNFLFNFVMPQSSQSLRTLSITKVNLSDSEMSALAAVLKRCTNLQVLDLSQNLFTSRGLAVLASILPALSNLISLDILNGEYGDPFPVLAPALKHCSKLERFAATQPMNERKVQTAAIKQRAFLRLALRLSRLRLRGWFAVTLVVSHAVLQTKLNVSGIKNSYQSKALTSYLGSRLQRLCLFLFHCRR